MALVLKDRVKQAAAAPGTGTITLGATAAGFQSFASVGNGNTTYFAIVDSISGDWEVNYGVYTSSGTTLTRNATPLSSSTGTLVNFTGAVDVFVTYPSENAVWRDTAGVVVQQSFGAITATSAALTSGTITGAPVNATDIVNKEYADSIASGLNYHQPVNYASTAALPAYTYNNGTSGVGATITANANDALSLGGGSPTATQRVLVKDEVSGNAPYNGIYVVTQAGSAGTPFILTRATDYDTSGTGTNEIDAGDYVLVISGTLASTAWVQQTPLPITVGTTALTFLQFNAPITYTAGTGLNLSPATAFNISNTGVTATTYGSASAVPVVTFNAQGQATGVTNTTIAIAGSQVSGNISGQAGSVANALTLGTYLTGGTYNGSAAVTATVDATSANTASKVVARDSSGNFSAGTITATLSGSSTSATTATNLAGGAANQIPYQTGSGATSFITAASGTNTVLSFNGSAFSWSAGTISGVPLGSNLNSLTAGTYLTGTAYNGSAAQTWTVDATSANTASKVVARDASGNFSASTITAALSGNATTATTATNQSGGTVSATTGAFSGLLTVQQNSTTAVQIATGYYIGMGDWGMRNTTPNGYIQFGPANSSYAHIYTDRPNFYFNADILVNGNLVLTSANYNSYAPTLTGTGASGTWGINITGSAGSAGSATTAVNLSGGTVTTGNTVMTSGWNRVMLLSATYPVAVWASNSTSYSGIGVDYSGASSRFNFWINGTSADISGTGTIAMTMNSGNYVSATGSFRAPIFYDSDNTGYYVDPSSTSSFYSGFTFAVSNPTFSSPSYIVIPGGAYFNSGTVYVAANLQARGGVGNDNAAALVLTGGTSGYTEINGSTRSPIYYDLSNTAYYVDPNGTSNLAGSITIGGRTVYTTAAIYDNTASGNNIGIAFGSGILPTDGAGTVVNNSKALGSNSYTFSYLYLGSAAYAPLYYDISDTSFYVDPAGVSSQKTILIGYTAGAVYNVASSGVLTFGSTSDTPNYSILTELENYAGNYSKLRFKWYTGIQHYSSQAYGGHRFYDIDGTQYFGIGVGGNWSYSIYSHRAPIFYDSDNTAYYLDPASTSNVNVVQFAGGPTLSQSATTGSRNLQLQGAASTDIGLVGLGSNGAFGFQLYGTGSNYGFLASAWGSWDLRKVNGGALYLSNQSTYYYDSTETYMNRVYGVTDIRSPVYYDNNNTSYYLDMNGNSNIATILTGYIYFQSNRNTSSSDAPLQAFSSGGSGAIMSFHRGGYYAVNMGLDSDNVFRIGGWSAANNLLQMDMSGNLTMLANVTAYSDERLKKDWDDLPSDFVPRLARVKSGTYTRIDNEMRQIGVGAQSLRPLMEEAVYENADGTLSVAYGNAAMASSVELARYVTALEQRISQLEARI